MKIIKTELTDVIIFEPKVFYDNRGFFLESYNFEEYKKAIGDDHQFVQDNHSRSSYGVLRGLHYQAEPYAQGKLVRCIVGEVFDVAVDIRKDSQTFGHWVGVNLSANNKRQLWIPPGFAHGFLTLSEVAEFVYKTTNYYSPKHERSIAWNDESINISWPKLEDYFLSEKDKLAPALKSLICE
ncbi:TPA: dTDP-4-dehydrorhamnose 3,5-epimerase [Citrobacter sedlakii]